MRVYLSFVAIVLIPSVLFSTSELPKGIAKIKEDFKINGASQNTDLLNPIVTNDNLGNYYVVWYEHDGSPNLYFRKISPSGELISNPISVVSQGGSPELKYHDIAVDELGTILIVWLDNRLHPQPNGGDNDIFATAFNTILEKLMPELPIQPNNVRDPFGAGYDPIYVSSMEHMFLIPYQVDATGWSNFIVTYSDEASGSEMDDHEDLLSVIVSFFSLAPVLTYYDPIHVDDNGYPEDIASGEGAVVKNSENELMFVFHCDRTGVSDVYSQKFGVNINPPVYQFEREDTEVNERVVWNGTGEDLEKPNIIFQSTDNYIISAMRNDDERDDKIVFRLFDPSGTGGEVIQANEITIFQSLLSASLPVKYMDRFPNDYFILVWHGTESFGLPRHIFAKIYDEEGNHISDDSEEYELSNRYYDQTEINSFTPSVAVGTNDRFLVTWADDRDADGTGGTDIYAALYQLDLVNPTVTGPTTTFDPPAKVFSGSSIPILTEGVSDAESGIREVELIYAFSYLWEEYQVTDSVICIEDAPGSGDYSANMPPPSHPAFIEYYIRARDLARNPGFHPFDPEFEKFELHIRELGDISGDGCIDNVDLGMIIEMIEHQHQPIDVPGFFANIDEDDDIDCDDENLLEQLVGGFPYLGCYGLSIRYPDGPILELEAVAGEPGETDITIPIDLENDSSRVSFAYLQYSFNSSVFSIDSVYKTARSQSIPLSIQDPCPPIGSSGLGKNLLSGNDSTFIEKGKGAILNIKVDVAPDAPEGYYHFEILRGALADTTKKTLKTQPLRGKFFIPEAPPVSIVCTPLSDTTLSAGDTLTFNTTLTNHSDSTKSPKFFIYGTTTGPDSFTFLAVDTSQLMVLPPGEKKRDITNLEVPQGAPLGHYVFTAYVATNDTILDEDPFGFQISGQSMPGHGGNQLASSGKNMEPWRVIDGWFGYNESKQGKDESNIASSQLPKSYSISQNYPNPFNPSTTLQFTVPQSEEPIYVKVSIYDIRGHLIRRLVDGERKAGEYRVHWDGKDERGEQLSSGIYLYQIDAGEFRSTKKMVLVR